MRRTLGGTRADLLRQFLGESLLQSSMAVALGAVLAQVMLVPLNQLVGLRMGMDWRGSWRLAAHRIRCGWRAAAGAARQWAGRSWSSSSRCARAC